MCPESTCAGGHKEQSPCLYLLFPSTFSLVKGCPQRVKAAFPVASEYGFRCGYWSKARMLWLARKSGCLAWLDHGSKHEEFLRHVTVGPDKKLPVPNYSWWHRRQNGKIHHQGLRNGWPWENLWRSPDYAINNSQENMNSSHINDSTHL